jgi:hypothetical protein
MQVLGCVLLIKLLLGNEGVESFSRYLLMVTQHIYTAAWPDWNVKRLGFSSATRL